MEIIHKIKMDLVRQGITPRIPVVQGDAFSRKLTVSLFADRKPWKIPPDASVIIRYLKPDHTSGSYDTLADGTCAASISGNNVSILVAPEALALAGPVALMATILQGQKRLSTFAIGLDVQADCTSGLTDEEGAAWIAAFLPSPEGAAPGQYLAVNTVDEHGHVLSVKAEDSPVITHEWDGTTLTLTSASGTSSADLKGEKGEEGVGIASITATHYPDPALRHTMINIVYTNGDGTGFSIPYGEDGLTPFIGENGNWWIGETDTGVAAGGSSALPEVTTEDNGKFLRVVDGAWAAVAVDAAEEASF